MRALLTLTKHPPPCTQVKDRFEFPLRLDMYPYTVEGVDEADGRVRLVSVLLRPS